MDLRVLEYFLAVAEIGGISRAAEFLHVSQPTLSRQLMDLEEELGRTLLVRGKKNISLTPDGLLFRETARDIVALYQKACAKPLDSAELAGDIFLGAGETEAFSALAARIKAFQELHPKVCFHLFSAHAEKIREDVDKGLLDLGLLARSVNTDKYESLVLGKEEHWGILLPVDHPLAGQHSIAPEALQGLPLILPENSIFRKEILSWISGQPDVRATYTLVRNALLFAQAGGGYVVCLDMPAESSARLTFVPFTPDKVSTSLLIWKEKPVMAPALQVFLDFLKQAE